MALNSSPRKLVIPLATGDEPKPRISSSVGPSVTRRVFYCGVVVEGSENGRRLPDEIQDLVLSLGNPLPSEESSGGQAPAQGEYMNDIDKAAQRKRALMDPEALVNVVNELTTSERVYVNRLQVLKHDYADPLRNFARSKETAIIPAYEAKTLFGNIDNLLPVNEAFLTDLERMMGPNGHQMVGGVGDVALKHFKELRGFELYKQYYVKREEAQVIFEKEVSKRSSRFASYIDHIKYQSADSKNRVGLRELIMEPVQRIPRYTLLFRTMLKHMSPDDPQRAKLIEADEIASKIAQAEADEQTKRAAIFYCLSSTIDAFPPELYSNSRKYIDCIDVEDILDMPISAAASSTSLALTSLPCTLFLFEDKLLIAKRPNSEKGGKALTGLDSVDRVTKAGGIPSGKKKSGMQFKGVFDITDIVLTDVSGSEVNLYLERPPQDQSERWNGRPFRSLSVVIPHNLDPTQTEADKRRFLENLWKAQATYRARAGQSVVLCSEEQEVENRNGRTTCARSYFNVYQRTAFLQEPKKARYLTFDSTKVVVHIDRDRASPADSLPFGLGGPPFVVIRVSLMDAGLCRYSVRSSDPNDEGEEDIIKCGNVQSRVTQTIHQFGLFQFKTGNNSAPSTPTARSKSAIFGLDAISRNLFNSRPGSAMGDFFAGSISGKRSRSRSAASRSSMYTHSTATMDSMKSSHRSNSTATAATTVSSMDGESVFASRSSKGPQKVSRKPPPRAGSPDSERDCGRSRSDSTSRPPSQNSSRPASRASFDYSDGEDDSNTILAKPKAMMPSEDHLDMQLELARQNSLTQHNKHLPPLNMDIPVESTILEEDPPFPVQQSARSRSMHRSSASHAESPTKAYSSRHTRSLSTPSDDRRLFGPRSPSPQPPSRHPQPTYDNLSDLDDDLAAVLDDPAPSSSYPPSTPSAIPRSKRQTFYPSNSYTDTTPKANHNYSNLNASIPATPIEPLSIKKKASIRHSGTAASPTPLRKSHVRSSPLSKTLNRVVSPRRVSPQFKKINKTHSTGLTSSDFENMHQLYASTKEDIEMSRRSIRRIKLEADGLKLPSASPSGEVYSRPASPEKGFRTPQQGGTPVTKEAQQRMEEMRNLLKHRQQGEATPYRKRTGSIFDTPTKKPPANDTSTFARTVEVLVDEADKDLVKALNNQVTLENDMLRLAAEFKEKAMELERTRIELQNSKRQCELVKSLMAEATTEKEIMYDAFNEELDAMYNDANLPDDEAWQALSKDLRQTKEDRNKLRIENSDLRRKLAVLELENEEWGDLLRSNGLIS
ncbi:hypothetical protein CPB83DRAFT_780431 [Crepidotus variabilis]|uniref:DH domain-containing protein n=1 Tax=Crepidotus variabilis TaxID=179855 RepID=A0A9P6EU33_9AGAR|nr:hypothetical protein CPB83DRAFT_780431 [Crepidotus variabilis]